MYSGLKNEIKQRESMWSAVYWELVEPVVKIRTLRARLRMGHGRYISVRGWPFLLGRRHWSS
ncbi:unnamed protein product [Camellia sinensis]